MDPKAVQVQSIYKIIQMIDHKIAQNTAQNITKNKTKIKHQTNCHNNHQKLLIFPKHPQNHPNILQKIEHKIVQNFVEIIQVSNCNISQMF